MIFSTHDVETHSTDAMTISTAFQFDEDLCHSPPHNLYRHRYPSRDYLVTCLTNRTLFIRLEFGNIASHKTLLLTLDDP